MTPDPLDALLERLSTRDEQAAAEVFRACEPYLRVVVRRHMPAHLLRQFDSEDIVQSALADVLDGFREAGWRFADAAHLRAFLVKVTRNRLIDRYRQFRAAVEHEETALTEELEQAPAADSAPSEVAQADDLWDQMLRLCPQQHHELLRLRRQGCTNDEIGARTGLHPSSVRRILYDLARRLATQRNGGHESPR